MSIFMRDTNGNLLQYSCLENPMDGGAWWATVHGVAKIQIWLSDLHFHLYKVGYISHFLLQLVVAVWVFSQRNASRSNCGYVHFFQWNASRSNTCFFWPWPINISMCTPICSFLLLKLEWRCPGRDDRKCYFVIYLIELWWGLTHIWIFSIFPT